MSEQINYTDDLPAWLGFLHVPDCRCSWEWKALGTLHLVSMGKGWVRMTTNPECPHHGEAAS